LFGAMGFWMLAISATGSLWAVLAPKYGASTQPTESDAGSAILNTVPAIFGLIALLAGDQVIFPSVQQDLGLGRAKLGRGVLFGIGGGMLVIPPLLFASQLMELIYRSVRYQHPTEHPLLRVLGEAPNGWITATLILGACLLAPVFEELVFRGHLQTLISRAIQSVELAVHKLLTPPELGLAVDSESADGAAPNPVDRLLDPRHPAKSSRLPPMLAIFITSLLFASVHPLWSFPIIFLLSLALGYAYERTGNLWVPIAMHATFNSVSTALFLLGASS